MPLTIIMPDGEPLDGLASMLSDQDRRAIAERVRRDYENDRRAKLGGDHMDNIHTAPLGPIEKQDRMQALTTDHAADLRRQHAERLAAQVRREAGGDIKQQTRGVAIVAAELEHAQEQAARVKPLREELDRLLGRKTRKAKVQKGYKVES